MSERGPVPADKRYAEGYGASRHRDHWDELSPERKQERALLALWDCQTQMERRRAESRQRTGFALEDPWVRAADVAEKLSIPAPRRAGNGAVKGSWSGYMSPSLRVAPALIALYDQGYLDCQYSLRHVRVYRLSEKGARRVVELQRGGG